MFITFGSGPEECSNKTPSTFGFNTSFRQVFHSQTSFGTFAFYNVVPGNISAWHLGAQDHTENDLNGYMFLVDIEKKDSELFSCIVTDLCIGLHYQFSAYLAYVVKKGLGGSPLNIRFEVQTTTTKNDLLGKLHTNNIPENEKMTWEKYALSFIATSSSINLRMISNNDRTDGNDLAIDDIELHVCSSGHSRYYSSG